MGFTAPKAAAFKQFVILDQEGVIAALSAIDGGQVDEILKRSAEEGSGSIGGQVDAKVVRGGGKKAKSRRVEEEMRLTRTRHSAAAKLLEVLSAREAVGVVEGVLDKEVADQLEAGIVLEFRAHLDLHPLHQADEMLRSFIEVAPKMGQGQAAKEMKPVLKIWEVLVGTGDTDSRLLLEPRTGSPQIPRLLLPVPKNQLEVPLDDVLGEVTVVAQIERLIDETETHQAIRMLRGPMAGLEKEAVEEAVPGMLPGLREIGVEIEEEDVFIRGPAILLRPICAYR